MDTKENNNKVVKFHDIKTFNNNAQGVKVIFCDYQNSILSKYNSEIIEINDLPKEDLQDRTYKIIENKIANDVIVISLGKMEELDIEKIKKLSSMLCIKLQQDKNKESHVIIDFFSKEEAYQLGLHTMLSNYEFNLYKTKKNSKILEKVNFYINSSFSSEIENKINTEANALRSSIFFARDCINIAPNDLYPEIYEQKIQQLFNKIPNINIKSLDTKQMKELGMNALLGVAQGSINPPKMVVIEYKGSDKQDEAPIAYIGKGVTFDTGGISLKPPRNMDEMKADMAGSAAVVGTLHALAMRSAKVNAVGIVGLVENMIGSNAQRPGDIVKTMEGTTVEVLNTDAEGRLVLADAMHYANVTFKPKIMIDVATLTGAVIVALGYSYAGCWSNNHNLIQNLQNASKNTGEKIWHMPLDKDYKKAIESKYADIGNISNTPGGCSCTAAQFLEIFANKTHWAHLDIANMTKNGKKGFGVLLLNELAKNYEDKN